MLRWYRPPDRVGSFDAGEANVLARLQRSAEARCQMECPTYIAPPDRPRSDENRLWTALIPLPWLLPTPLLPCPPGASKQTRTRRDGEVDSLPRQAHTPSPIQRTIARRRWPLRSGDGRADSKAPAALWPQADTQGPKVVPTYGHAYARAGSLVHSAAGRGAFGEGRKPKGFEGARGPWEYPWGPGGMKPANVYLAHPSLGAPRATAVLIGTRHRSRPIDGPRQWDAWAGPLPADAAPYLACRLTRRSAAGAGAGIGRSGSSSTAPSSARWRARNARGPTQGPRYLQPDAVPCRGASRAILEHRAPTPEADAAGQKPSLARVGMRASRRPPGPRA